MSEVRVPYDVVEQIVSWWRSGHEAPGGCSFQEALAGMREPVWQMELARREQFERSCHGCGRTVTITRPCPFCGADNER